MKPWHPEAFSVEKAASLLELLPPDHPLLEGLDPQWDIYLHRGDLTLPDLDLDFHNLGEEDEVEPYVFVVLGNLTLTQGAYCRSDDGAKSLLVLGHLLAGNMIIGGQALYVEGNMTVQGVFYGSYNHGFTRVKGDFQAGLMIIHDEYVVDAASKTLTLTLEEDSPWIWLDSFPIPTQAIFEPGVFIDPQLPEEGLSYEGMAELLSTGSSLLQPIQPYVNQRFQEAYGYFPHTDVTPENMSRIMGSLCAQQGSKEMFSFDAEDLHVQGIFAHTDEDGDWVEDNLLLQKDTLKFFVYQEDDAITILTREGEDPWATLEEAAPLWNTFSTFWKTALASVAFTEHYGQKTPASGILSILNLTCTQGLNPFADEDYGLWNGDRLYRFYRPGDPTDETMVEIQDVDECRYFYEVINGQTQRFYRTSDDEPCKPLPIAHLGLWEKTQLLYEQMVPFLEKEEASTLALEIPLKGLVAAGPPVLPAQLAMLREAWGLTLSPEHQRFLEQYNGLDLNDEDIEVDDVDLRLFFGVGTPSPHCDLNHQLAEVDFNLSVLVPLGCTRGGDYFVQALQGPRPGAVYLWDHEVGWDSSLVGNTPEEVAEMIEEGILCPMAPSFAQFIRKWERACCCCC